MFMFGDFFGHEIGNCFIYSVTRLFTSLCKTRKWFWINRGPSELWLSKLLSYTMESANQVHRLNESILHFTTRWCYWERHESISSFFIPIIGKWKSWLVSLAFVIRTAKVWFVWILWYINHCWLFNAKSSINIYIKYRGFGLVGFYGISTILGYLIPNPF